MLYRSINNKIYRKVVSVKQEDILFFERKPISSSNINFKRNKVRYITPKDLEDKINSKRELDNLSKKEYIDKEFNNKLSDLKEFKKLGDQLLYKLQYIDEPIENRYYKLQEI